MQRIEAGDTPVLRDAVISGVTGVCLFARKFTFIRVYPALSGLKKYGDPDSIGTCPIENGVVSNIVIGSGGFCRAKVQGLGLFRVVPDNGASFWGFGRYFAQSGS